MQYKIEYPYFGIKSKGTAFVIIEPNYAITLEHKGTMGFGFSAFVSRAKILQLYKCSKQISKEQFQELMQQKAGNFFSKILGSELVLQPLQEVKRIGGCDV